MRESKNGVIVLGGFIQGLALVRSLAELSIPVYVAEDKKCLAGYSRYCNKLIKCPEAESLDFASFFVKYAQRKGLKDWLLIPTDDHQVEAISQNAELLGKYYRFLVPPQDKLQQIINKKSLLEVAERAGTNIPRTCYYFNIEKAKEFRYPLLIKGNYGRTFFQVMHKKAFKVFSFEELDKVMKQVSENVAVEDVMIQELIPTRMDDHVVSFTCFAEDGEIKSCWMGEKLRERPIENGTATFAQSVFIPEILQQATPLVSALEYTGVCEIEYMYDHRDNKWNLIEINPRTWKWVGLAKESGIDYAKMLYWYMNSIPQKFPKKYEVGIKWVDSFTDVFVGLKMLKVKRITLVDYIKSYQGKIIHASWNKKDPLPAMFFPLYAMTNRLTRIFMKS